MLSQEIAASNRTRMSVERVITASGMQNGKRGAARPQSTIELYRVSGRNSVEKGLSALRPTASCRRSAGRGTFAGELPVLGTFGSQL